LVELVVGHLSGGIAGTTDQVENGDVDRADIALSLGPFGASLIPTQEFDGCYPWTKRVFVQGNNHSPNSFGQDAKELDSTDALTRFPFENLQALADDFDTWKMINVLAFEKPLVRGVRLAVSILAAAKVGDERCQF